MPSLLSAAVFRRQDPAPIPAPSLAVPVPSPPAAVPAPANAVPAAPVPTPDAPIPAPAVPAPAVDSAVPSVVTAPLPAAPVPAPDSPAPSPDAATAPGGGIIGADPAVGPDADGKRKPKPYPPVGEQPPIVGGNGQCPPIWNKISRDLTPMFLEDGQCNDLARGAIRAAFHDCGAYKLSLGTDGGCDGSLFLAPEELDRQENVGLKKVVPVLGKLAQKYGVGMADFFQFAAAHAVKSCPLGPTVQVFVGRKDTRQANPEGLIPNPRSPGNALVQLFEEKGISPPELAALIGAHTASKQRVFDPTKAGTPLDSTVGVWDVKFYAQVLQRTAPFILPSDAALAKNAETGRAFKAFAASQGGWSAAFSPAMTKLGLLGVERAGLVDCTAALPQGAFKRNAMPAKRSWWQQAW
ncbi:heme peroxidase [Venturia nashicola]|nr:heme peroxidase [Venturia nashicola]